MIQRRISKTMAFFLLAREHGIKADLVAASVHVAHFLKGKVTERIDKDIFQLIDKEQYKNIWVVGLSLGGLNSLLVLKKYDKKLCGAITLAPYLLNKKLTDEFEKEDNSKGWMPSLGAYNDITEERIENVLVWLRTKADRSKIYIGYGDKDVYGSGQEKLASLLINKNSIVVKGKHNWETGKRIWKQQLLTRQQTGLLQPCY